MNPQDFKAKHFLLRMSSFIIFWQNINLITMEPDEFSGIIGLDIRIVLCSKVNIHKAEILPKTLCPFPLIQKHYFPTAGLWISVS